jgi:acetyltransferase-like isoleucine patch superfamily enzyme
VKIKRFSISILKLLLSNSCIRFVVLSALYWSRMISSLLSYAKTFALFPEAMNSNSYIHWTVDVGYPKRIKLGKFVRVGPNSVLGGFGGIEIGDNVRMSRGVRLETGGLDFTASTPFPHISKPIKIEDDVWVGAQATILGGVSIGRGAVIGAQAVVTRSVAAFSVVAGNPARPIRTITKQASVT